MANLDLVGQVQSKINGSVAVTATKIAVKGTRPVTVKYGPLGAIGVAKGFEKVTCSLTLAVPKTGLEFDINALDAIPGGFSFQFPIGAERHVLLGLNRTDRNLTNTPEAGDTEFTLDLTGTEWIRTR